VSAVLSAAEQHFCEALLTANTWSGDTMPAIRWVAPFFAAGSITAVTGRPKEAGKSTFLLHLCRSMVNGEPFLGQKTHQGGVIYVTEEPAATVIPAALRVGVFGHPSFRLVPRTHTAELSLDSIVHPGAFWTIHRRSGARCRCNDQHHQADSTSG
jgi:hypothetical protein